MRIEMAYRNGRVDVFDTMSFTAPSPLGKENALTNFELRFDELGKTGLWLAAHHYDVDPSGTGAAGAFCWRKLRSWTNSSGSPLTARWP